MKILILAVLLLVVGVLLARAKRSPGRRERDRTDEP